MTVTADSMTQTTGTASSLYFLLTVLSSSLASSCCQLQTVDKKAHVSCVHQHNNTLMTMTAEHVNKCTLIKTPSAVNDWLCPRTCYLVHSMYTVNHKKRDILFLTITLGWLILTDFYRFYIILIVKKFCIRL